MSAPPDNKQRFASSVFIPMGNKGPINNGQQQQTGATSGSAERVIPIHVEGRDEPIIPKNIPTSSAPPPPQRVFGEEPRPQTDRIFGQRPEQFTQFVREPRFVNDGWHQPVFERRHGFPEEEFMERSASPAFCQRPQQQQQEVHQQSQVPHPRQPEPSSPPFQQEKAPEQQPKPQQKQPLDAIDQIKSIQKDVSELLVQVENFSGMPKDKPYLYLDEMLTRNLLKLDNIDTQGQDAIRSARKEAIKCIEKAISVLEEKAAANLAKTQPIEISKEESNTSNAETSTEDKNMDADSKPTDQSQSMEVVEEKPENENVNTEGVTTDQSETQKPTEPDSSNQSQNEPNVDSGASQTGDTNKSEVSEEKKEKKKIKKKKDN